MSIFRKLFGGSEEINGSRVRAWAEKEKQTAKLASSATFKEVFIYMIAFLSHFGAPNPKVNRQPSLGTELFNISEIKYSGDSALFELGCFMFAYVLEWVAHNWNSYSDEYCSQFIPRFVKLFQETRGWPNIPDLFQARVVGYDAIINSDTFREKQIFQGHLKELILRTENNTPPQEYDFSSQNLFQPHSAFDSFYVESHLQTWAECSLSRFIEAFDTFLTEMDKIH